MFVKIVTPVFDDSVFSCYQTEVHECTSALWREASESWKEQGYDWELFLLPQHSKLHFIKNRSDKEEARHRTCVYYMNSQGDTIDTVLS